MPASGKQAWKRLTTREEFVAIFTEVPLTSEGLRFIIHEDGRIAGDVDGRPLSGSWYWEDGYFCRTAELDGEFLDLDCEIIEHCGDRMRYTRERGNGQSSIVQIARS
ncbi:hypothetical protein [Roseibium sp. M-1]